MNALCARLQDVNEAGAYRLNCPLDQLLAAVTQTGFALFEADLSAVHGKNEFLTVVARAIRVSGGFGNNWDALADVLGDFPGQSAPGYVLLLRNGGEALGLSATDQAIASEVLAGAVSFWKSQGKPFWVFRC